MRAILQTARADERLVEASLTLAVNNTTGKDGRRQAEKRLDEKERQVKLNRERGWGVSCDEERWSWGSGRKGRPGGGGGTRS